MHDVNAPSIVEAKELLQLVVSSALSCPFFSQWWRTQSEEQVTRYRMECANEAFIEKMLNPVGLWRIEELWKDGQLQRV